MARYVAFLRGLNVGGHTVTMKRLKELFEGVDGIEEVSTFIASGNVLFRAEERAAARLERTLEAALEAGLGYEVATFLRTEEEVAAVAAHAPFARMAREGDRIHVMFLMAEPDAATRERLEALSCDEDLIDVHGREVHWLRRGNMMDSTIDEKAWRAALGKAPTTVRNTNTVQRIAAKLR